MQRPLPRRRALLSVAIGGPACLLAGGRQATGGDVPSLTVDDRVYLALARFREGFHCSQSVLAAYADGVLSEEAALRMGAALAGGSTVGGECGAVAAGYLVLGLKHGRTVPVFGDVERERELFDRIRLFVEEFRKRHGAITCRELLGLDVFTREGLAEGRRRGLFRELCPRYVRDAITILESVSASPVSEPATGPPSGDRP
jgi:C_GCAxxG_C_C family probable redox protein